MSTLKKTALLFLSGLLFVSTLDLAKKKDQRPVQGKPPRPLTQQRDGHWSANKQAEKTEGYEVHTVKSGDTLWDITKQYLKDPYLWPQVWEMNPNINNPHWIYSGDQILIKKMVVVNAPPEPTPSQTSQTETKEETPKTPPAVTVEIPSTPSAPPTVAPTPPPVASYSDIYCAGFFSEVEIKPEMNLVGGEESETKGLFYDRDIVYVSRGASVGVKPGEEYLVLRSMKDFGKYGPAFSAAKRKYGHYYQDIGRVRILLAHENSATAEVVFSCEEIKPNDFLVPNEQRVLPTSRAEIQFDKFAPPNNKTSGRVFMTKEYRKLVGQGQIIYIDVGQRQNVQVGDYFRVTRHLDSSNISLFQKSDYRKYRQTFDSVRKIIGEGVVLRVEANTSSALVTLSTEDIALGDGVELE